MGTPSVDLPYLPYLWSGLGFRLKRLAQIKTFGAVSTLSVPHFLSANKLISQIEWQRILRISRN